MLGCRKLPNKPLIGSCLLEVVLGYIMSILSNLNTTVNPTTEGALKTCVDTEVGHSTLTCFNES